MTGHTTLAVQEAAKYRDALRKILIEAKTIGEAIAIARRALS